MTIFIIGTVCIFLLLFLLVVGVLSEIRDALRALVPDEKDVPWKTN